MVRKPLIAGNWKMNGSLAMAAELTQEIVQQTTALVSAEVLVCPPAVYLSSVQAELAGSQLALGAQNVSERDEGAYTGEIACSMLRDVGCSYVIVGHSERRQIYGESSELVSLKAQVVAAQGLKPIVCVGETLDERQSGHTENVIAAQLAPLFQQQIDKFGEFVIAYEPVWAIGTGETASPEQAQDMHKFIRGLLTRWQAAAGDGTRILYGGSVKPDNAAELFGMADVDGGLIGGAALNAESFVAICNAV